jgi:hypothetical protein
MAGADVIRHMIAFIEGGRVVATCRNPAWAYPETNGITQTPERLYLQRLHANWLGCLPR